MFGNGQDKITAIKNTLQLDFEFDHIKESIINAFEPIFSLKEAVEKLGTRGTAHETLASAVYCFVNCTSFIDTIRAAVLIAGDCDSRAAVAGTYYGLDGIPQNFIDEVEDTKLFQEYDEKLSEGFKL